MSQRRRRQRDLFYFDCDKLGMNFVKKEELKREFPEKEGQQRRDVDCLALENSTVKDWLL